MLEFLNYLAQVARTASWDAKYCRPVPSSCLPWFNKANNLSANERRRMRRQAEREDRKLGVRSYWLP